MKNSTITYLFGFFFLISCIKAVALPNRISDTSVCLEIEGIIINAGDGADKTCRVDLMCANHIVESVFLKDGKKKVKFLLHKNQTYTIKISKQNHITKLVCIDTRIKHGNYELYSFSFETRMFPESVIDKADRDYLDFPVALIYFDTRKDCFVHDKEYSKKLNKAIAIK